MIRIVAVGKRHETWVSAGIERYEKRLGAPFSVEWDLLAHSTLKGAAARQEESRRILSRIKRADYVVLLDETGRQFTSPALSNLLEGQLSAAKKLCVVIGGAYGVNEALKQRANVTWSLSKLVFPHQLVRLILIEQLYRAASIQANHPYHHA